MIDLMLLLSFYLMGILTGAVGIVTLTLYLGNKAASKKSKDLKSIDDRMKKVKEITTMQLDLQAGASGPQKNALDGKYKNGLISELKRLEEEKNVILTSIIADGFDPEVTVMDEMGVVTKLKLSEFMAMQGITMPTKNTDKKEQPRPRFTVHRGGLDDDGDGGETTH